MGQLMYLGARLVAVALLICGLHTAWAQSSQDPLRNPFKPPTFNEIIRGDCAGNADRAALDSVAGCRLQRTHLKSCASMRF